MLDKELTKVKKYLKNRNENQKATELLETIERDFFESVNPKTKQKTRVAMTDNLIDYIIRKNINPVILNKIFKGDIE